MNSGRIGQMAPETVAWNASWLRATRAWSVDRWGRLLAGSGALVFSALALWVHPAFLFGTLAVGLNLVITSLTDRCALHDLLLRLGAREREDMFLPGGALRPERLSRETSNLI